MHKYQADGAIGSSWHPYVHDGEVYAPPIQEDETALVLFMFSQFYHLHPDKKVLHEYYDSFIKRMADFMAGYIDETTGLPKPTYDLWEEKFMTHTYTTAVTRKALLVAANFAEMFGYDEDYSHWKAAADVLLENQDVFYDSDRNAWRKGFLLNEGGDLTFDNTLDVSSWYGAFMFDYYKDKKRIIEGAKTLETELLNSAPTGGVPRYEYDGYFKASPQYKGNPWFVTTLWLAQYYIRIGRTEEASELIMWCLKHAGSSGALSEQVHPESGMHTGVSPLVWSHAELINTILDISSAK
jgi:GH15 family glucan-1,4-alpha-glucosidase